MQLDWFKPRGYKHFDAPVGDNFALRTLDPVFVEKHSWLPLIHYTKRVKRYKPNEGRTVFKERPIMYASHRDACILARYSAELTRLLDEYYEEAGLTENVIAYRKLGRSNFDFASDAYRFAQNHVPCVVLCFDITGFFDNLNHRILKDRLKRILSVSELPSDWYRVFRHVTHHSVISREELAAHPVFGPRLNRSAPEPFATIAEVIAAGIQIKTNDEPFGIPQGTPISSALSNLYMMDVDREIVDLCETTNALYQRYSDDILIICAADHEHLISTTLADVIKSHRLELKTEKSERAVFDSGNQDVFQYLGFNISPQGAVIRPGSIARQWRKLRRSIARTKKKGVAAIAEGKASTIFTRKLRRRFQPVGVRNFSSYARKSAKAFGSKKIVRQVHRLERAADDAIRDLKK